MEPAGACDLCTRAVRDKGLVGTICGASLPAAPFERCPGKIVKLPLKLNRGAATRRLRKG